MKKLFSLMTLLVILLGSCASPAQPTEDPADGSPSAPVEDSDSLGEVLIHRLSVNLGIDESGITIRNVREMEFSDLCLEISSPETACAQVVTPGHIFILEANGMEYEYRTTALGDTIRPASLALTWTREGGFAGFCDRLTVFLSGEVYGSNCRSEPNETSSYFSELISTAQQEQFNSWFLKFGETSLDESDPAGVADRMVNTLVFYGTGTGKPRKVEQQALFDWANSVFQKLNS
jgi:hypothetical protein